MTAHYRARYIDVMVIATTSEDESALVQLPSGEQVTLPVAVLNDWYVPVVTTVSELGGEM